MELEILNKNFERISDEEIREIRTMHADLRSRGFYDSSIRINNENEIKRKWAQEKDKVNSQIRYYKALRLIAWIPLISGLKGKSE